MKMIPGMSQMPGIDKVKVDPKDVARKRAIVLSMTPAERHLEVELSPARRRRLATGSGNSFIEVNKFIKQFNQSKDMMQGIMNGDMNAMMSKMMGGQGMPNMPKGMGGMNGMPDMSQFGDLSSMMGQGGQPDMSAMFGGGLKGKASEFAMKQAMKRAQKKMKKKARRRNDMKKHNGAFFKSNG